jgi:uncharacterized membrane protein (DUF106 family)
LTGFFTVILKPFESGHAYAGLIFISVITGGVMLFLFKLTSNQEAMKEAKTKISAYFLELRLYKDDVSAVLGSQARIMRANAQYMKLAVIPAVVMIIPVVLIMVQLNLRYSHAGLGVGDTAIVKVKFEDGVDAVREGINLVPGRGITKASPVVRIPDLGEADWKIRLAEGGTHDFTLTSRAGEVSLPVFGTSRLVPIFNTFKKNSFQELLFNPGAPRIPDAMPVASVQVHYPPMGFNWGFISLSWLWSFLIISMAFGMILKFLLGVE